MKSPEFFKSPTGLEMKPGTKGAEPSRTNLNIIGEIKPTDILVGRSGSQI
ncbi:MAG: hypothetical protein WCV93_02015 [Candidatus Shapirobacteria bacterium]|jgi:hypothetical protein